MNLIKFSLIEKSRILFYLKAFILGTSIYATRKKRKINFLKPDGPASYGQK